MHYFCNSQIELLLNNPNSSTRKPGRSERVGDRLSHALTSSQIPCPLIGYIIRTGCSGCFQSHYGPGKTNAENIGHGIDTQQSTQIKLPLNLFISWHTLYWKTYAVHILFLTLISYLPWHVQFVYHSTKTARLYTPLFKASDGKWPLPNAKPICLFN